MSNQPKIPNKEIIDRHVAKMEELGQFMEQHITDLEQLNTRLETEFYNSFYGKYRQRIVKVK